MPYFDVGLGVQAGELPDFFTNPYIQVTGPDGIPNVISNPLYQYEFQPVFSQDFNDEVCQPIVHTILLFTSSSGNCGTLLFAILRPMTRTHTHSLKSSDQSSTKLEGCIKASWERYSNKRASTCLQRSSKTGMAGSMVSSVTMGAWQDISGQSNTLLLIQYSCYIMR